MCTRPVISMSILFVIGANVRGRVACCPLVSHGVYTDGTDRQTDGRQTVTLRSEIDAASITSTENGSYI